MGIQGTKGEKTTHLARSATIPVSVIGPIVFMRGVMYVYSSLANFMRSSMEGCTYWVHTGSRTHSCA
ncbi:hypothetical protein EON65_36760 [archaeon]|nr:MAG: hypothetical protein EON65_36760 [archaeon]